MQEWHGTQTSNYNNRPSDNIEATLDSCRNSIGEENTGLEGVFVESAQQAQSIQQSVMPFNFK